MKVGSLVECVKKIGDDQLTIEMIKQGLQPNLPVFKNLYVVRSLEERSGICLEEISNEHLIGRYLFYQARIIYFVVEPGFIIEAFREVQPPMQVQELVNNYQSEPVAIIKIDSKPVQ